MGSILMRPKQNKIFLIYGNLDDMFLTGDLVKSNFRFFLNRYLKSIGYEQIVFYSGARNVGKFVLDDESAVLAIRKNQAFRKQTSEPEKPKRRRILRPHAVSQESARRTVPVPDSPKQSGNGEGEEGQAPEKMIYKQPKITPVEFLDEAKKMMSDTTHKSAVVFTFFQDFLTDPSAPLQPYLELVSYLWDEYSSESNENICIFLAPHMSGADLGKMFDGMEKGSVFRNRFFNADGTVNKRTTIEIGLPGIDEIGYALDHLRIVGEQGRHLCFCQSERKKLVSSLLYLSREAEKHENGSGYLYAIYNTLSDYMRSTEKEKAVLDEAVIRKLYRRYQKEEEENPFEKLRNTRGWECVADRIEEILKDYRLKKGACRETTVTNGFSNERIDGMAETDAGEYPVPHFVLKGNPGVGKTTIARLIGRIFYEEGILRLGNTVEAKRDDLVGMYVGETAIKTTECVERAREGVLFIDDAYSLLEKGDEHNYPKEAIDTLVPILTNPQRYRFCMIMAGYPQPMEELLAMNSGLKSRFHERNILTIEDYKPELLQEIFVKLCEKDGYHFEKEEPEQSPDLKVFFENLYRQRDRANFGNARDMVALADEVKRQSSLRDDKEKRIRRSDFGEAEKYFVKPGAGSAGEIYDELTQSVGMKGLKEIISQKRVEVLFAQKSGESAENICPGYYFFVGNPGTGKSTSAAMFAKCLFQLGIVGTSRFYSCTAKDLIGQYVGETDKKTYDLLQKSMNGVLFIDEAYSLSYADDLSNAGFKKEAVEQMIAFMDEPEHRKKCCIILAGYEKDMQGLYRSNSGMRSRIEEVRFDDYSAGETYAIFENFCKQNGFAIAQGVKEIYIPLFAELKKSEYFSNGRTARTIYEKTVMKLKRRVVEEADITEADMYLITPGDLLEPAEAMRMIGI